jgi:hypothetical protein
MSLDLKEEIDLDLKEEIDLDLKEEIDLDLKEEIDLDLKEEIDLELKKEIDLELKKEIDLEKLKKLTKQIIKKQQITKLRKEKELDLKNLNLHDKPHSLNHLNIQILDQFKFVLNTNDFDDLNISNKKETESKTVSIIFKKIQILFIILSNLLKYCILKSKICVDEKELKTKVKFPKNIDELSAIMGFYTDVFDDNMIKYLFEILSFETYKEFHAISTIHMYMIPFTTSDINISKLQPDFKEFTLLVKYLTSYVLNLNTDLKKKEIIETTSSVDCLQ